VLSGAAIHEDVTRVDFLSKEHYMAPGFEDATPHCATSAAIARSDAKEHAVASDSDDSEGSEAGGMAWLQDLKLRMPCARRPRDTFGSPKYLKS
jgi:hypothetical protein